MSIQFKNRPQAGDMLDILEKNLVLYRLALAMSKSWMWYITLAYTVVYEHTSQGCR